MSLPIQVTFDDVRLVMANDELLRVKLMSAALERMYTTARERCTCGAFEPGKLETLTPATNGTEPVEA